MLLKVTVYFFISGFITGILNLESKTDLDTLDVNLNFIPACNIADSGPLNLGSGVGFSLDSGSPTHISKNMVTVPLTELSALLNLLKRRSRP
jgi:hypothetical protein